ncbi:hypothetical protein NXS19_002504 [Fusarium pseudograminearum]|nr:hypothetical protein NXS19_002504 [Fusarium pseudograminearum]
MARGLLTICVSALLAVAGAVTPADTVFYNGNIYTMNPSNDMVTAMAVRGGKIEYAGDKKTVHSYIGKKTKVIDLEGRMVMPGLVDSHMHLISGGLILLKCDLSYQTLTIAQVLEHIQGCIDGETGKGDDDWIEVVNMDYAGLVSKSGNVGKAQLDKLSTKRPASSAQAITTLSSPTPARLNSQRLMLAPRIPQTARSSVFPEVKSLLVPSKMALLAFSLVPLLPQRLRTLRLVVPPSSSCAKLVSLHSRMLPLMRDITLSLVPSRKKMVFRHALTSTIVLRLPAQLMGYLVSSKTSPSN